MSQPASDVELARLMALDTQGLAALLQDELVLAHKDMQDRETRFAAYLDDLRAVLGIAGGAGVRVLRHWLDGACANERLSRPEPALYAAAALYDYARDRMAEVALADPVCLLHLQLEGARQWAATNTAENDPQGRM